MRDTRGIVHPRTGFEHFTLDRFPPSTALAAYVDWFWLVRWDLPPGGEFVQPILAHPSFNLVIEPDAAALYGVPTVMSRHQLSGAGWALAVKFRPGGARVFLSVAASELVDQVRAVDELWGRDGTDLVEQVRNRLGVGFGVGVGAGSGAGAGSGDFRDAIALLDDFLTKRVPDAPPADALAAMAAVELVAQDRELAKVEQLAGRMGRSVRGLQRLFAEYVGLSPKQVICRYRLLEAAEAAANGGPAHWAEVAARLGFADQAHLTREFSAAFGQTPSQYARGNGE